MVCTHIPMPPIHMHTHTHTRGSARPHPPSVGAGQLAEAVVSTGLQEAVRSESWAKGPHEEGHRGKVLESHSWPSSHSGLREGLRQRLSEQSPTRKQGCRCQTQSLGSMLKA